MIKNIEINFPISGTKITFPFQAVCSITNKLFEGKIIIAYKPKNKVIEYVSAEREIKKLTKNKLTVEELANLIFSEIKRSINPLYLKVIVNVINSKAHQPVDVWIESPK